MQKKVFVRDWEMVPQIYRFQRVGLAILYSLQCDWGHFNFHVQAIVEFHVLGIHLPSRARDYQIGHQSQCTFGASPSLPFWWPGFQLAWSPLRLERVLGSTLGQSSVKYPNFFVLQITSTLVFACLST